MILDDALRRAVLNPAVNEVLQNLHRDPQFGRAIELPADVEPTSPNSTVLRLKWRKPEFQNSPDEMFLASRPPQSPFDWVLLVGQAPTVDGFFLASGTPFQLKTTRSTQPRLQPLGVIQAVTETWTSAKARPVHWRNISVYVETPDAPIDWVRRRWTEPIDPRLDPKVLDGPSVASSFSPLTASLSCLCRSLRREQLSDFVNDPSNPSPSARQVVVLVVASVSVASKRLLP